MPSPGSISAGPPNSDEDRTELVKHRIERLDELAPERRRLMLSDKIRKCLSALMDDEPVLISQNIPFRFSPSHESYGDMSRPATRNAHVHHYSHVEPIRGRVMAWLALEDVQDSAGPMWVCPGSHKQNDRLFDDLLSAYPKLCLELLQLRNQGASYRLWVDWFTRMQLVMTDLIEDAVPSSQRIPIMIEQGDLVLFDAALSHGTVATRDPEKTRWSIVAKYHGLNAVERSWASWFGHSIFQPALKSVSPATFKIASDDNGGYYAFDSISDHQKMFWSQALPEA